MKLHEHIALWNHASVKLLDIRSGVLEAGEEMDNYRLPSSAFLYIHRGYAQVRIDEERYSMSPNHILHGGRAACLFHR